MDKPIMHCQYELDNDLTYKNFIPHETILKWFNDRYSTSKHLLNLYSIARGLNAKSILEIGFGRSSFILAKVAHENGGHLTTCDLRDFSYLLNERERSVTTFINEKSDKVWPRLEKDGLDFAFLDYFSSKSISHYFIMKEIRRCLKILKTNGIIAVHDSIVKKYKVNSTLNLIKPKFFLGEIEVLSLPYNYGLGLIRKTGRSRYGIIVDDYLKKGK